MKIMHIADVHLDSAFSGFERDASDKKREQLRNCFASAMERAREMGVSLILIAGDLFDTPFCSSATRKSVFDAIESAGCPVVIAPGNHDYYNKNGTYADKNLPDNAFVFTSSELGRFDFDELGVSVLGYAFTSDKYEENPLASDVPLSSDNLNILCAHADLGAPFSKYAPISANAIARGGFVYAALGHVHIAPTPVMAGNTVIAYSGFAQGRSFDELGEGGVYVIDLDRENKSVELERVPLSSLVYRIEALDITACTSDDQVKTKMRELIEIKEINENTALRIVLKGAIPSGYNVNEAALENDAAFSSLALLQVRNESVANFDLEYLERDMTVRGEVYRQLLPLLNSDDDEERKKAALALKFALAALDKREFGVD